MSGRLALSSDASSPRLLVLDGESPLEVFDVLAIAGTIVRARSALLFEVGEELSVRIERDGSAWEGVARVRAHVPDGADRVTELVISERPELHLTVTE